jgi:hypothetical protein
MRDWARKPLRTEELRERLVEDVLPHLSVNRLYQGRPLASDLWVAWRLSRLTLIAARAELANSPSTHLHLRRLSAILKRSEAGFDVRSELAKLHLNEPTRLLPNLRVKVSIDKIGEMGSSSDEVWAVRDGALSPNLAHWREEQAFRSYLRGVRRVRPARGWVQALPRLLRDLLEESEGDRNIVRRLRGRLPGTPEARAVERVLAVLTDARILTDDIDRENVRVEKYLTQRYAGLRPAAAVRRLVAYELSRNRRQNLRNRDVWIGPRRGLNPSGLVWQSAKMDLERLRIAPLGVASGDPTLRAAIIESLRYPNLTIYFRRRARRRSDQRESHTDRPA